MASKGELLDKELTRKLDQEDRDLIHLVRRKFNKTMSNWKEIREDAVSDQKYYTGLQQDTTESRALRAKGGSPQIQVNMIPNFVQQVENSIRQQNIGISVHPTDETGTEETAKILQGIIRHIEHQSQAKTAYLWAAGSHGALVPGFGFLKIETEYCDSRNGKPVWDQEIFIRGVKDPMKILPDYFAQMPDFSDSEFWFEFEELAKDVYIERYADSKLAGPTCKDWSGLGAAIGSSWMNSNSCRIVKYWYKVPTIRHFCIFEDGTEGFLDEFGAKINDKGEMEIIDPAKATLYPTVLDEDEMERMALAREFDAKSDPGAPQDDYPITDTMVPVDHLAKILRKREVTEYEVKWILTNGFEILDRGDWNDSEFPFVGVIGQDVIIDGKRDIHGIVRYAKDPQKMVNFFTSQVVRRVDAANKSAWIAAAESIPEPQRRYWDNANIDNRATLYYQSYDEQGRQLPAPTRGDAIEPAVQQMMAGAAMMSQSIKATIGIYEAGLGQTVGDRQSGNAIDTLAERGEINNFHFSDNLVMSIKRLGKLLVRLIPKIYDAPRTVRMVGLDDEADLVKINQMFAENGQMKEYNIKDCTGYDVVIDTGPTYASKKSQMVDNMLKFASIEPTLMPFLADLIAKNMDWDTTGAVSERIQLVQAQQFPWLVQSQQGDIAKLPPEAKAMIMTLQKQLQSTQQAAQHVQGLYAQEKNKNDTQAIAHQAKLQQVYVKEMFDLQKQRDKLVAEAQQTRDKLVLERTKAELAHVNERIGHIFKAHELLQKAMGDVDQTASASLAATTPQGGAQGGVGSGAPMAPQPMLGPAQIMPPQALPPGPQGPQGQ